MSIMKSVYKQEGGVIAPGLPNIDVTQGLDKIYEDALAYSADPANIPQFYTDPTVAQFDPLQTLAQEGKLGAADEYDRLTANLVSDYESQLDPTSAINQHLAEQAATRAAGAYFGAGTPGSARGQYTSALAAQDAVRANRQNAQNNLAALRGSLTGGSDIVQGVGDARQKLSQDIINEDIKRFNYAQLSPQQQLDRLLGLASQQQALKYGNVGVEAPSGLGGIFGNLLGTAFGGGGSSGGIGGILGSLGSAFGFEDGGEVGVDGQMMPQDPMMQSPGAPLAPQMGDSAGLMPSAAPEMPLGEPMGAEMMQMTAVSGPEVSDIDKAEGILAGLAAASGGNLKIKRKTKGGK